MSGVQPNPNNQPPCVVCEVVRQSTGENQCRACAQGGNTLTPEELQDPIVDKQIGDIVRYLAKQLHKQHKSRVSEYVGGVLRIDYIVVSRGPEAKGGVERAEIDVHALIIEHPRGGDGWYVSFKPAFRCIITL